MSQHTESTILPWNHLEEQETLISSPSFGTRRNARVTALQVPVSYTHLTLPTSDLV